MLRQSCYNSMKEKNNEKIDIELEKMIRFRKKLYHGRHCRAGSGLDGFGSNSKLTKRVTFLVCGRCYLNNLSLKIALPARVNKVSREFASKDLVDCYGVV